MVTEVPAQSDGNTAFLRAARAGHLDKVLEQLKNNVDINTSNANGLNALHLASKDGHINIVSELLRRGANVDSATKKGNTALHIASLAGQEEVVKHLVEHGACVNVQSQNGFTPLYMAAQENHDAVVRFLLSNGANQSLATEDGFTPLAVAMQQGHDKVVAVLLENDTRGKVRLPALHIAAKKDDCKAAALLLQNEHNPDVTSKSGFTPLHIASHYGNEGIANLLLSKGADVNYAAKHNITPLHVAAKWGKANMVSVLLSRGANIEAKTRDGLTPLHCAARSGHEQVVDMLLERGAPISAKTKNGLAALHMSSQGDHVDAARILLYHRAPVDDVTVDYLTALHVAAHCGHVGVARLLLDRKADPNARALNGFTPLHIACKKNRIKVVELLLKHGASIEATTESGLTPLHVASFMGCMNIVIYLVQNEASPDVTTVRGETPLHLAARANQTDIIRILLRNGATVDARAREQQTPLHIASRLGNVDIVMLLLQHGASVDSTTKDLYTALHIAAKEGQDEVASVLLENGASLEATTKKGFTPLHLAAKYGHMNVAKLLLRRDAPVDAQGKNGVTPLHVASHYDHQNVALLLLEKGASPHATAKNGHTPLHIAARKNQMDIATTLLEYGAKADAESKAGFTPLHLSAQEGHTDMSNLLIEHQADVNHKAKNGLTPLHLCAQEDRVPVGTILLKNNAEIDSTTKAGYTPLHVASHFGQMGMVRLLLAEGASVTPTTAVNYTPLHQAAQQGHSNIVNALLEAGANPNATTNQGQTALSIAQKLGYISVVETLKGVTDTPISPISSADEKYKVVAPETMQETFMSDSEDEGGDVLGLEYGFTPAQPHVYLPYFQADSMFTRKFTREDTMLSEQPYHYLTVDEMKGLGDDSLPIDVTRDERDNRDNMGPPTAIDDTISPQHIKESYSQFTATDNVDITKHPLHIGKLQWRNFLVSFLVDARGGAMRGCRHSGVRVIVPPRRAPMPLRVTCRYLKRDKLPHPPPLMEGEALASRILELGPVGAKFLGPVMIEVPHFGSLRGKEREIVILRSDNGESWREHTFEASEEAVHDVLSHSFEKEELSGLTEDGGRTTRIVTTEFPQYIAVVSRVRQEVHAIGPEGGMVSSTVVPQVQAVFPHGALTKKIKVGLQAQPIPAELTAKLLGNRVAVSPIVTVEPRRRKFHKPISLTIPVPQAANKGMINQYSGDAPTLRLLCSITGGTTRAQWEDVTGSTPLTFVNDCVSFTTTVSARFWLMDCRNISEATKMATELYREAIHVPFMAKFVVFAKRVDTTEARLRVFCMTDDKEDKTLEHQEQFTEVAKSRDVEVLEGKMQYLEFAGNLIPVTKSGEQLQLGFRAFKENRLPFTVRVKDPHADAIGRTIFMREPKVAKGDAPQQPICILNIVLPENIIPEPEIPDLDAHKHLYITHTSGLQRLSDISNLLGEDWTRLASELGVTTSEVNNIKSELCESSVAHQALAMLRLWLQNAGNKASASTLEEALRKIGREDIIQQTVFSMDQTGTYALSEELSPSYTTKHSILKKVTTEKGIIKDEDRILETRIPKVKGIDKDDGDEKKYIAEEKDVKEEVKKSVSERKKEIERRLSQDVDEKKQILVRDQTITTIVKTTEKKKDLIDEKPEKETAEEKAVSPEPAHMSFDEKRKSFELGITPKEKIKTQEKETIQKFITEEQKIAQEIPAPKEEEFMSFQEKRRSFEQGLSMKKPGDKLPAAERKKETTQEIKKQTSEEKRVSDFRRDSELFEEVSQGLGRLEKGIVKPQPQELLSPNVSKTPPPSPAEFNKETPDNKKWSAVMDPSLTSGQEERSTSGEKISHHKPVDVTKIQSPVSTATITQSFIQEEGIKDEALKQRKDEKPKKIVGILEKLDTEETEAPKMIKEQEIIKEAKVFKEIEKIDKNEAPVQETIKKQEIKDSIEKSDLKGAVSPASAIKKQDIKEIVQKFDIKEETLTKQEIKENIDRIDSKEAALPETVQVSKEIITKSEVKEAAIPETIKGKVSVTETVTKEATAPETIIPQKIKETIKKIDIKEVTVPETIIPPKSKETTKKIDIKEVVAPEIIKKQEIIETIEKIDIKVVAAPETIIPQKIKETIEKIDIKEVAAPETIIPQKIKETIKIDIKEVEAPETIIPQKIKEIIKKIDIKEVAAPEIIKKQEIIEKIDIKEASLPEAIKKQGIQETVTSKIIEFIAAPEIRDKDIEESVTTEPIMKDDFKEAKITEPKPFDVEKDTKKEIQDIGRRQQFVEETEYKLHTDDVEKMVEEKTIIIEEKEEEQYKPYVTTPTQSRRVAGIGGSQRLSREERPTVRIVTDFVEDSDTESESENYIVTEPVEKRTYPARKGVKFRFDSEDYREDKASDEDIEEIIEEIEIEPIITEEVITEKKLSKTERRFERMASDTTVADTKESEGEFQRIISQMSTEEVNQALEQWDKGGMTPSEGDSKDTTTEGSSDHISPIMQEGSHSLEPEEHGETPPIPSPRTPIKPVPRESSKDTPPIPSQKTKQETTEKDTQKFASKKMFWEQMSTGSIDESTLKKEQEPPIPKPRMSIPTSSVLAEISKEISYSDTSRELEVSDIDEAESLKLQGTITTDDVAHGLTKERTLSQDGDTNSEVEYIATHELEDLSYDNPAFSQEECESSGEITVQPRTKKPIYERSASLPCDSSLDISSDNVRVKKRIFEAQIKKEMVVEQLMAQLEEESSPEHKSIGQQDELPATDTEAMVSRQIHSDIFSKELDEQIESLIPESKDIYQEKTVEKHELTRKISSEVSQESSQPLEEKSDEVSSESQSIYDPNLSSSVAEALQYKNDVISKPSDSLEVHVDKSEIEDTEKVKEIEEELRVMEEKEDTILQMPEEFDKVKVSSITSSQGESEDTFSESDVTPEDARYREQQDIQVYGPTEKESKLMPDKEDEQKKQRNVYTPEEHIPDTVWEVPVQEEIYSLQEETVQQIPLGSSISLDESEITEKIRKESITESEAREIAEIIVEDIESKLTETELPKEGEEESEDLEATDKQGQITKKIHDAAELDISKKSDTALRYIRTDTTTSSMEITDEDLRSSGVDTDVSPLESQAGCVYPMSVRSGEESSDDVDNQELEHDLVGKEDLDKTLAEVRQSLEAVKEELIEEKKKKKDSITKESPSEFEFKVLSLEKTFSESIQECHHEEVSSSALIKKKVDLQETSSKKEELSSSETTETTQTKFTEQIREEYSIEEKEESQKIVEEKMTVKEEAISETSKHDLKSRQEFMSEKSMSEESQTISQSESITLSSKLSTSHEEKTEETTAHTTLEKSENGKKEIIQEDSDISIDELVVKDKVLSESTTTILDTTLQSDIQDSHKISEALRTEIIEVDGRIIETAETQETEIDRGDDRKSPTQDDVTSASDSSEKQGGSDSAPTFDKPNIIIRKHKKSSVSIRPADPKSDYELYSSSGESHYHSFEQTSESIRTPGSRPLSSDIEGLVPNLAGVTGSSEYESAISGQSTTMTSKDFHTAVSSLSSRDSMKSLDSESSGNLASVEVSSEASETLVPSAMELEKDMEPTGAVEPVDKPVLTKTELRPKAQSFSESNDQSVSFDISAEDISEDEEAQIEQAPGDMSQRMKRSHEMTFQPEPRPISEEVFPAISQEEKYASSLDDMTSLVSTSDTGEIRTVIEVSRTESDRMDGSATSEQLSLTVSGTSELLSLSDVKDIDDTTVINKVETTATQSPSVLQQSTIESVTITTSSVLEQGIQSVCTQVTSKVSSSLSHSNGPTQVEYNAEYDEGEPEVKKKGHRRNGSTSFRPSMVPVFYGKDLEKKKSEEITEDSAESDKYTESLTLKEGSQEEKKDVDEAERLEDEFYQTEADQGLHRDIREGRVILEDTYGLEELKDLDFAGKISKSRLSSAAFSDDHPDSELAELLKQCSTEVPSEDPIERPKTPEPVEECEIKDDTPEFSSEAQASVTELEMEYSGAFSRTSEYEAHISPIREKELLPQDLWEQTGIEQEDELAEAEAAFQTVSSQMLSSLPQSILEESIAEKHELETQEIGLKEEPVDRSKFGSSPVPDITITQHMVSQDDSFEYPDDLEAVDKQETIISVSSKASSECETDQGQEYVLDGYGGSSSQDQVRTQISPTTQEKKEEEKDDIKEHDSNSESPTSDSFELLEKPDIADEFVIIEEVGREAQEQDSEGKGLKIGARRVSPRSHTVVQKEEIVSPPSTATKMTKLKYFGSGGAEEEIPFDFESGSPSKVEEKTEESSQEGSPPSAEEQDEFKPEVEAGKKWMEMQFQGEPIAQIYGYEIEYERGGPLEDIKEEDINDLESSSKIGSMGSQVSHSIGSFGSVKESLSSTPDYDVLAGRRFFTRSGEHDDVSMSSLQEFERLENLIALESTKHRSLGSQDSLTSSSNSRKHGSRSGGDDISLASLKEFEGLESACIAAERIEKKAKAEEESLLSEIEEGHESQASESESCVTVSVGAINRGESDEDDYEKRMFEIDEIIRQAQTNVESFMDAKSKELLEEAAKRESLARADSLEEISKVPDLDFDQPLYSVSYSSGKSYIQQWSDLGEDLLTSTDSLEMKTQISKMSVDPFTTSTDSLEVKMSQDVMSVSTDSIEASQKLKKKDVMTDSIEVGEKSSMITSTDSLEGKVTQANSLDEEEQHIAGTYDQSSSSGKDGDLSSSGREDSAGEGAMGMLTNRMPPPRAEYLLGSTDSLEPTSSTATHATYQYETDSVMSSSFTSGDSATMVDDNDEEAGARAAVWFDEGKPYVTEVIEPTIGDDDFSHMIHRTVEMPPEIHKVTFKGKEAEQALRQYIERFDPGEDISETREEDDDGNVHVKRVIQRRVIIRPEEMGGDTTDLTGPELEKYLKSLTDAKMGSVSPLLESVQISTTSMDSQTTTSTTSTTITTKQWTSSQGETIKTEQQTKEPQESRHREGEEEQQELPSGYSDQKSGSGQASSQEKKK